MSSRNFTSTTYSPLPPFPGPAAIYHGQHDDVVPLERTRQVAEQLFPDLEFYVVDTTHDLNPLMPSMDWPALLEA